MNIIVHKETFGITQHSLSELRNELARRIEHEVRVVELEAKDGRHVDAYGYALLDRTTDEVIFIGDGFRGDGGGEGGAGHRAAQAILAILGISRMETLYDDEGIEFDHDTDFTQVAQDLMNAFGSSAEDKVPRLVDRKAHYIDHIIRR